MKRILFFLLLTVIGQSIKAQNVGIGTTTPNTSAAADIVSTTKGLLIPRLTTTQRNAVSSPAIGLMIYNTTDSVFNYYRSSGWTTVGTSGASPWAVNGANIYNSNSGRVGIGTTAPDASAKLDISSTTAGLLVPRMTIAQKISIASPATGLIVYDTDLKEFSYYDGTSWLRILNGNYDYWNKSLSRHWVYNITDSIGLGTSSPGEKLEVNGNIRSRDNILADGYITAAGNIQGGALTSTGNLLTLGTGVVSGDLQTNSDLLINNSAAILQLKSSNVNKGFYQLSGDNVRFGTNSGNTGGDVILRMNGDDMISFHKNSSGGASMQMNTNGVAAAVLQTTSLGNILLSTLTSNALVQLGGEVHINSTTNSTGIGTASPLSKLHILNGADVSLTSNGYLMLGPVTGTNLIFDNNEIMARNNGATASLILQNDGGTVRIGDVAVPSGYKFAINGKMICEELKVKLASSGWPDYVFDNKYKLPSLPEVEKFIQQNKHLPNIPSAEEVEKNGIEVGDIQKRMMEKIEELTLYIIELKKEMDDLRKTVNK